MSTQPDAPGWPTPDPEINAILRELLSGIQTVLGADFLGMYLDGSLTSGDFDQDSDIDFVVVTSGEISEAVFQALKSMHERIAEMDSPWVIQLEGSYLSRQAIRRYDPMKTLYPNIERGEGERLKMARHDATWDVHRFVLRERGIRMAGPEPQDLIDPVLPNQLRRAMLELLDRWAAGILNEPEWMTHRGYQSYIVLSLCRVLYTLHSDRIASKSKATDWVKETLRNRWAPLIDSAWVGRHNPGTEPLPEDVAGTLAFIRYTLEYSQQWRDTLS